jgi:hypothetical protein
VRATKAILSALGAATVLLLLFAGAAAARPQGVSLTRLGPPAHPASVPRPRPIIGIGDQQPDMFTSPRWKQLRLRDARYIAPWDVLEDPGQLGLLDAWLRAAGRAHARAVVGFAHSLRSKRLAETLPTWRQFQREFKRFRKRYPTVRDFIPWNEANNPGALTANRPYKAAQYYDVIVRNCRGCNVAAADLLDGRNMIPWLERFRRAAHYKPRIWGMHNYTDANRFSTRGTSALLANTRGQIWFTETGGVVLRRIYQGTRVIRTIRYGVKHATAGTEYALRLSCLSKRIARIYLYEWQPPRRPTSWDSGLLDPRGRPRPAFYGVRKWNAVPAKASASHVRAKRCR